MDNFNGKKVLITGGSSGIGLALAKILAGMGADIWLLARDPIKLNSACEEVKKTQIKSSQTVGILQADVGKKEEVNRAIESCLQISGVPDLLVNSAGITYPGLFHEMSLSLHRENMEVNYFGTLYSTFAVVPAMMERGSGYIVNISSLVGIHGLYGYSAYSPSKFAVRGLSDVLRYELKPYGIEISVVFPTDTETPQLEFENKFKPPLLKTLSSSNTKPVSAESVANAIIRGIVRRKYLIFPSMDGNILFTLYNLLPGEFIYRFVDFLMNQARRKVAKDLAGKENKTYPD